MTPYFLLVSALAGVVAGASKIPGLHFPDAVFGYATLIAALSAALAGATPGLRKMAPALFLALGLGFGATSLTGCRTTTPAAVIAADTGVSIEATFEAVRGMVLSLRASGAISDAQFAAWGSFEARFKAGFHGARLLLDTVTDAGDGSVSNAMMAVVNGFVTELMQWESILAQLLHPDGGQS